jgi:hypothetical protein
MIQAKGTGWDGAADGTSDVYAGIADFPPTVYTASGAISDKNAFVILNAGSALAMTLALPVAGGLGVGDDGKCLKIISYTSQAHTITCTSGLNGGASSTITFANAGDGVTLRAYNGYWWIANSVTASFSNQAVVNLTSAGAIAQKTGLVTIGSGAALAMTLANPASGTDDGKVLTVAAATAHAHTLTVAANFDGSHHILTYSAAGQNIVLMALGGAWYLISNYGGTLS